MAGGRLFVGDLAWTVASTFLFLRMAFKVRPVVSTSCLAVCLVTGPLSNVLLAWTILARPATYAHHRAAILSAVKLQRLFLLWVVLWNENQLDPDPLVDGPALMLAPKAIMMVAAGLGFQLPLRAHLRVHSIALAASLAATRRRCSYECALAAPRQVHERAARALAAGIGKVFPLALGSQGLGALPPLAGPLPCLLVQAWLQVAVGFLIPTLFIDATAAKPVMWHVPLRRGGVQTLFLVQRAGPLLCWYLGLLAVAAVVWWQALALGAGALVGLLAGAAG